MITRYGVTYPQEFRKHLHVGGCNDAIPCIIPVLLLFITYVSCTRDVLNIKKNICNSSYLLFYMYLFVVFFIILWFYKRIYFAIFESGSTVIMT